MSVLQDGIRSGQRRGPDERRDQDIQRARVDAVASCSCTATMVPARAGEVLVLRVTGEVDLLTIAVLQGALTSSLARGPCHLLVDLAELTFCSARGLSLLVQAGCIATGQGTGYSITAASRQADHAWTVLWPVGEQPIRYPTAAAGVAAALAEAGECRPDPWTPLAAATRIPGAAAGTRPETRSSPTDSIHRTGADHEQSPE